jgi:hexosaminidase
LGSSKTIQQVTLGCLQRYNDWIFLPQSVAVEYSVDGQNFTSLGTVNNTVSSDEKASIIKDFTVKAAAVQARYIRVTAKVIDACPKGHSGEGKPGWLFADEIIVE